jgi:GDP-L-fucose synthase
VWDSSRPDGQPSRRLDVSRARELMGFEARVELEEGLRRTVAWYERQVARFGPGFDNDPRAREAAATTS